MKHITRFEAGHDCIEFECKFKSVRCVPGGGGSHGRGGLSIRFVSAGELGAVQFLLYTGWTPKKAKPDKIGVRNMGEHGGYTMPAYLCYHSPTPRYEGQTTAQDSCEYCGGKPCYYDGSSLNANDAMYALVNGGDKALWAFLDAYYEHVFCGTDYPEPAEYPTPRRAK